MARNPRYRIFFENNVDMKLKVLLSIKKYKPRYSELLRKTSLKKNDLKPILKELMLKEYIVENQKYHYQLKRPLPSEDEIKIYRYILRRTPTHSPMLRSLNEIDAKRVKNILNKFQEEGILHYDIKHGRYSIVVEQKDIVTIIINSINSDEEIEKLIQRYRKGGGPHYGASTSSFLNAFFDFDFVYDKKIDLIAYLISKGYQNFSQLHQHGKDTLINEIIEKSMQSPHPFWQDLEKYLFPMQDSIYVLQAEEVNAMDEGYISKAIDTLPPYHNHIDFIKALENVLFDGYRHILTLNTSYSYLDKYNGKLLRETLYPYYINKYPEIFFEDTFKGAVKDFFTGNNYVNAKDRKSYVENRCASCILSTLKNEFHKSKNEMDFLENLINNGYIYKGIVTKNMQRALFYCSKDKPNNTYTEALEKIFPVDRRSLSEDDLKFKSDC